MQPQHPSTAAQANQPWWHVAPWPIHALREDGTPTQPNRELAIALGLDAGQLNDTEALLSLVPRSTRRALADALTEGSQHLPYRELPLSYRHRNGTPMMAHAARVGPLYGHHRPLVMLEGLEPRPPIERAALQARLGALIAHDYNNIFTVARSFIDLSQRPDFERRTQDFLTRATGALDHGIRLNELFQTFCHPEVLGPLESCDLGELMEELRPFIGRLLQPGPTWQIDVAPGLQPIEVRRPGLQRLILDLCVNAFRSWPRSPILYLELRPTPGNAHHLLIKAHPTHDQPSSDLPPRFDALFCRRQISAHQRRDPLFIEGILPQRKVAIDISSRALTAWLATTSDPHRPPH